MLKKVLSIIVIMVMVVSYGDLHVRAKETINVVRYMNNGYDMLQKAIGWYMGHCKSQMIRI